MNIFPFIFQLKIEFLYIVLAGNCPFIPRVKQLGDKFELKRAAEVFFWRIEATIWLPPLKDKLKNKPKRVYNVMLKRELPFEYTLQPQSGTSNSSCQNMLNYVIQDLQIQAQSHTHQLRCSLSENKSEKCSHLNEWEPNTNYSENTCKSHLLHLISWHFRPAHNTATGVINSSGRRAL